MKVVVVVVGLGVGPALAQQQPQGDPALNVCQQLLGRANTEVIQMSTQAAHATALLKRGGAIGHVFIPHGHHLIRALLLLGRLVLLAVQLLRVRTDSRSAVSIEACARDPPRTTSCPTGPPGLA